MSLFRLMAVIGTLLCCSTIAQAQFISEDEIPLEIQTQIIDQIVAEHGHLDVGVLEESFREWLLSQPLPSADGELMDSGTCDTCAPPTDNENLDFPPVRDIRIVTRTRPDGTLRNNFTVRWRRPVRLSRPLRQEYELDHYEVFLSRDDGTFEQHVITERVEDDGSSNLPRRIRFRRRAPGEYSISVRPVYVPIETTETQSAVVDGGVKSATPSSNASSNLTNGTPVSRMLSSGIAKGPGTSPPPVVLSPDESIDVIFEVANGGANPNQALYDCVTMPGSGYTGATIAGDVQILNCADQLIDDLTQLQYMDDLRVLNLGNLDTDNNNNNDVCDIQYLTGIPFLQQLNLTGNTRLTPNTGSCGLSHLSVMNGLFDLTLDRIGLNALPALSTTADYYSISIEGIPGNASNLNSTGYSCLSTPSFSTTNLNLSHNALTIGRLPILSHFSISNLDISDNSLGSLNSSCADIFDVSSLDLSNNTLSFAQANFDLSQYDYFSLNLNNAGLSVLPTGLPELCGGQLLIEDNAQMQFLGDAGIGGLPSVAPNVIRWAGSDNMSCTDHDQVSGWYSTHGPGQNNSCFTLGIPSAYIRPADCRAVAPQLNVNRSGSQNQHILNWNELTIEGNFREFKYRAQKRFAGIHPPNSSLGQIGPDYIYGETGTAIVSDTIFGRAYEFRLRRCVVTSGVEDCGAWSLWTEGDYPLTHPTSPQVVWTDPVAGDYYVNWSYPESYFDGHGNINYFLVEFAGSAQAAIYVQVNGFQDSWSTEDTAHNINIHGNGVNIRACTAQNQASCGIDSASVRFADPVEFNAALTAPVLSVPTVSNGNEVTFDLTNMTTEPDPDNNGKTVIDYYEITETIAGVSTVSFMDISDQAVGVSSSYKVKRYSGGEVTFSVKACIRNRNGSNVCSDASPETTPVMLAEPQGFNSIEDTLCWRDRTDVGLNVQLEWAYSNSNGVETFLQPAYYRVSSFSNGVFFVDAEEQTNEFGLTVVNQNASGVNLNQDTWSIEACLLDEQMTCGLVGFVSATTAAGSDPQCTTAPPPINGPTRQNPGGPANLRPGVWADQDDLPRQGFTFYWASDLRFDELHEEYGDSYDLFAYWQTYRQNDQGVWDAVWLYSRMIETVGTSTSVCGNNRLGFDGALYYPNNNNSPDMDVGHLQVCFDPENNSAVNIQLDVNYDATLTNLGGDTGYILEEISTDTNIFPPTPPPSVNGQDFHNGSFTSNDTNDQTKVISWTYSFLEGLIVLGFDDAGQPMWANGILDCREQSATCTGEQPRLNNAGFEFTTAQFGIAPFSEDTDRGDELVLVSPTIDSVLRNKAADANSAGDPTFTLSGNLAFNFNNDNGQPLRSFSYDFDSSLVRESSFHDIRFNAVDDNITQAGDCPIENGECAISLTWFSDSDFLGTGVPSIRAFYERDGATPQLVGGDFCGAGDPVADPDNDFVVTDYTCLITTPGDYVFTLMNRVGSNGVPTSDSVIIARSTALNVLAEGTSANDDLGVVFVDNTPLLPGETVHDHSLEHTAEVGTLAGEAGVSGGAASYSIPINIPPGRQGMQPSVSLSYNSRAGNGTVGMGWSLSAGSAISRCPSTIAQDGISKGVTYTDSDRLCLDGQRLMVIESTYWSPGSVYRTEIDSFVRVTLNGSGAANNGCTASFTVLGKDNLTRDYGNGDNQRVQPVAVNGGGCVANSWLLTQEKDQAGNTVNYTYSNTNAGDGEQLLSRIDYTGDVNGPGDRSVRFAYDTRTINGIEDVSVSYLAGYRSEQTRRLDSISTFVGTDQVRQYNLMHTTSSATGRLLLEQVQECAYQNNAQVACLEPTQFDWGDDAPFFGWEAIQTAQDNDRIVNDILVDSDPLGYDIANMRVNGGSLAYIPDLDGDGSRELSFTDQGFRYIASVDAEGVERWRVNMALDASFGTRSNGSPQEFMLASEIAVEGEDQRYQEIADNYAAQLDLSPSIGSAPLSASEQIEMRENISDDILEQIREAFNNRSPTSRSVDYDGDGILDLSGVVPVGNEHRLAFAITNASGFQSGPFENQFTVLVTNIVVPTSPVTGLPSFQVSLGDINGDGLVDAMARVSIPVTDDDDDLVETDALRLWINADSDSTDDVINYEPYSNGIPLDEQGTANPISGLIYIWPYNVQVQVDGQTRHIRELAASPELTDFNGDGLQDIVISSNLLEQVYTNTQFADARYTVIVPTGYQQANVRVLLNRGTAPSDIEFKIVELSADTVDTTGTESHSRGSDHLGLFSDPRLTYNLPMDVNGDGLQDYLLIPNDFDHDSLCSNTSGGCWFLQLNLGGAIDLGGPVDIVQPIFSPLIQINLDNDIFNSMQTLSSTGSPTISPLYGNLIRVMDWNNDGRSELLVPRQIEQGVCVARLNRSFPDESRSEFCPVNMNGQAPTSLGNGNISHPDPDFNGKLLSGETHAVGLGHLDRSTYAMGVLEFDLSSLTSNSIQTVLIDHDLTGIIANNQSVVDDGFGDGITDLLSRFGCVEEVPNAPTSVGSFNTRCWTDAPVAVSNGPVINLIDPAATQPYTPSRASGTFRGYYISRNQTPREQTLDLMLSATDGFGNRSNWSYAPLSANPPEREGLTNIPLYVVPDRSDGDGYVDNAAGEYFYFASSMYVVSQFDQSNGLVDGGNRLHNITFYGYEEAVFNNQGRGFQGFRKVVSEQITDNVTGQHDDSANDLRSVSVFHQLFPLAGRMEASYTQLASIDYDYMQDRNDITGVFEMPDNVLSSTTDDWSCRVGSGTLNSAGSYIPLCHTNIEDGDISAAQAEVVNSLIDEHGIYHPVMVEMESESRELDASSTRYGRTTSSDNTYDAYGNMLTGTVVSESLSNDIPLLTHTQMVANEYTNTEGDWWLGKMTRSETRADSDYPNGDINTEQVKITTQLMGYDTGLRKPNCVQVVDGPSSAACGSGTGVWQQTDTIYNSNGNPTTVTVTATTITNNTSSLIQPRVTETGYTNDGYFPDEIENAEDHLVLMQVEPREGNPILVTDANGLVTRMDYDPFGRSIETWYPISTGTTPAENIEPDTISEHYAPRSSTRYRNSCTGAPTDTAYCMVSITDGAPITTQYMDSLNRAIQVNSNGFAGNTSISEQSYNGRGQMVEDTVARYTNGARYINEYRYDALGRMTFKAQPTQTTDLNSVRYRYTHYVHTGLTSTVLVGNDDEVPSCVMGDATLDEYLCVDRTYATNGWLLSTTDAHAGVTSYYYDGQGNPTQILDIMGNETTAEYNNLGHREELHDPNMGDWTYTYNGLGEVVSQTDANNKDIGFEYDRLGRLLKRTALVACNNETQNLTDTWVYDQERSGLLDSSSRSCGGVLPTDFDVQKSYDYDDLSRLRISRIAFKSLAQPTSVSNLLVVNEPDQYFGRSRAVTWYTAELGSPNNMLTLSMYNKYDINGYLTEQGDSRQYNGSTAAIYNTDNPGAWRRVTAMTPAGQVQTQRYGNGLTQVNQYYAATWQMQNTFIDDPQPQSPDFMDYFYEYDLFGNVKRQTSHNLTALGGEPTVDQEDFIYDRLHRLTNSTRMHSINNGGPTTTSVDYRFNEIGNITMKNDYATGYAYGSSASNGGPNAVSSVNPIIGQTINYTYDNNGNMLTSSNGRSMVYDVYNKPVQITNTGGGNNEFWYDADEQRYLQRKNAGPITQYMDKAYERTGDVHKLYMSDFAVFTVDYADDSNTGITYLHKDRLGSVAVMSTGQQEPIPGTSKGYDPFGKPRDGDWMDGDGDLNGYEESTRGFTGHEHLNETDLIHMNGRTYDYNLGRFLSVDPVIQAPANSQSLNPYSYIMNNPLSGTDPTGYTSFGLNGGKCGDFSTGSCDSAFFGSGTDERENRRNGKSTTSTQGATTTGSNIVEIGDLGENSSNNSLNAQNQMDGVDPDADLFGVDIGSGQRVAVIPAAIYYGGVAICSAGACELILAGLGYLVGDALVDAASDENGFVSSDGLTELANGLSGLPSSKPFPSLGGFAEDGGGLSDLRGPTFNEEAGNAAQGLNDLTGLSTGDAEEKLRAGGFVKKPGGRGSFSEWRHPDGSRVFVRPDGEIVRQGPSRPPAVNPHNSPNVRDRFDQFGNKIPFDPSADTHSTGEIIGK